MNNSYIYILIMFLVTYIIRVLPLTLMRKKINNRFIQSFLHYVPYVSLAVMTFPTMIYATQNPISGVIAFIIGVIVAWYDGSLFRVALSSSLVVFIIELFL